MMEYWNDGVDESQLVKNFPGNAESYACCGHRIIGNNIIIFIEKVFPGKISDCRFLNFTGYGKINS